VFLHTSTYPHVLLTSKHRCENNDNSSISNINSNNNKIINGWYELPIMVGTSMSRSDSSVLTFCIILAYIKVFCWLALKITIIFIHHNMVETRKQFKKNKK